MACRRNKMSAAADRRVTPHARVRAGRLGRGGRHVLALGWLDAQLSAVDDRRDSASGLLAENTGCCRHNKGESSCLSPRLRLRPSSGPSGPRFRRRRWASRTARMSRPPWTRHAERSRSHGRCQARVFAPRHSGLALYPADETALIACPNYKIDRLTDERGIGYAEWREDPLVFMGGAAARTGAR